MTIAEAEEIFIDQMPGFYDRDEVKAIASLVIQHVCHISKSYYLLHKNTDLTLAQEASVIRILDELRFGRPVQHVLGETVFYGLPFKVNSSVLVPRPETEELVEWILKSINADKVLSDSILDIGTGSGCIPIALKKNSPSSDIFAMDISPEALEIARQNCELNDVAVKLLLGNILEENFTIGDSKFDIIVSNPPYVTQSEKQQMHQHVLDHEPHIALFVPDDDPMLFYRSITDFAARYLTDNGFLFFEINESYSDETSALLRSKGFLTEVRKDLQGKERMIKASRH